MTDGLAPIADIVSDFNAIDYADYLSLEDFGPGDDEEKIRNQGACLRMLMNT